VVAVDVVRVVRAILDHVLHVIAVHRAWLLCGRRAAPWRWV